MPRRRRSSSSIPIVSEGRSASAYAITIASARSESVKGDGGGVSVARASQAASWNSRALMSARTSTDSAFSVIANPPVRRDPPLPLLAPIGSVGNRS